MRIYLLRSLVALLASLAPVSAAELVTIRGSPVVARAFSMAVTQLSKENGIEINFVPEANGPETIDRLGRDVIDMGLFTRKLTPAERAMYPEKRFIETLIGRQAVLIVVPDQVWRTGVHALSKDQFVSIYEREVKNWKQFGGEDRDIVYYNREVGRGVWDLFMIFLYGDIRKAPLSKAEVLSTSEEVRTTVEFNGGAISALEYSEVKDARIHPLGVKRADGTVIEPTMENIENGRYEMSRPLYMVTSKRPTGKVQELVQFMTSKAGQECVKKAGHVPLAESAADSDTTAANTPREPSQAKPTRNVPRPGTGATIPPPAPRRMSLNTTIVIIVVVVLAAIAIVLALVPLIFRSKKRVSGHHTSRH